MDLSETRDDLAFRERVREWLHANVPRERRPGSGPAMRAYDCAWQRRQFEGGWAGIAWPAEYGGCGLSLTQQLVWYEEYARAGAPVLGASFVGLSHAGPTLILRGTDAQKREHLPRILRGDAVWCQGFSEALAGSDLASLRTRAVVDGDHLVVTGTKIWTSYAHLADVQELLVRTDAQASKHKGLTWVICGMKSPGITVRPIPSMSGESHFCEVFYDGVRIPLSNVVGAVDDGWSVAMSTLAFERGTAFMSEQVQLETRVERLIEEARAQPGPDRRRPAIEDDELARRLATARAEVAALRAMTLAAVSRARREAQPGPEGSMLRLYHGLLAQRVARLSMDVLGTGALAHDDDPESWTHRYLYDHAQTIGGGTAEIQKNIVAERLLGLPK